MQRIWLHRPSPAVDRNLYVPRGATLGYDLVGRSVVADHALVVIDLFSLNGGWVLTYRPLRASARQASTAVNSRMTPVAS